MCTLIKFSIVIHFYYKDNTASYICVCEAGWTGANCDQNITDCDPNPCQNGATCNVSGYHDL